MDSIVAILIIACLIIANGVFVAAEFAIVSAPRAAIERRARLGSRTARLVRHILRDPRRQDRFIATAQLGITAASLALGMYGERVVAVWIAGYLEGVGVGRWVAAHALASALAVSVLTYFHIVVGEMVPKSLALQNARRTVMRTAPIVRAVQLAAYPLVVLLNGFGNAILGLLRIDRRVVSSDLYQSPEELAYMVRESQAGGLLRETSANVVSKLLEFADLTAGVVMVPRVRLTAIPAGASSAEIRSLLIRRPHTRYPVHHGTVDEIAGVVHVKDLLRSLARRSRLMPEDIRPVPFLPQTAPMDHVLAVMRQSRSQMVIVMDEHGGTAGLITLEDLFEEIAGELGEDDTELRPICFDHAGRLHVDGAVRLEEVGSALGITLHHPEVDTVSGLVLSALGRPPLPGDVVSYQNTRLEVLAVEGHGVARCLATPAADRVSTGTDR